MRITIDTPDITCTRCGEVEPVQPHILKLARLGPGGSRPEFSVTDSSGSAWLVQSADRPKGWTAGPAGGADLTKGLCPTCSIELKLVTESFMSGAALEEVVADIAPATPAQNTTPIRYIDRPPTHAIPTYVQSAPTRTAVVNHVAAAARSAVSPTPPPPSNSYGSSIAQAPLTMTTSKVSTNTLPPQQPELVQVRQLEPSTRDPVQVMASSPPPAVEADKIERAPAQVEPARDRVQSMPSSPSRAVKTARPPTQAAPADATQSNRVAAARPTVTSNTAPAAGTNRSSIVNTPQVATPQSSVAPTPPPAAGTSRSSVVNTPQVATASRVATNPLPPQRHELQVCQLEQPAREAVKVIPSSPSRK